MTPMSSPETASLPLPLASSKGVSHILLGPAEKALAIFVDRLLPFFFIV